MASFEVDAPDASDFGRRIEAAHVWLVKLADDGEVAGYAYGGPHRARAAYRWTVETSVYVAAPHQGRGVGRALYEALLVELAGGGFHLALAGITLPNPASVSLHESLGFEPVGVFREIGFKAGAWWDVGWWQRVLPGGPAAAA